MSFILTAITFRIKKMHQYRNILFILLISLIYSCNTTIPDDGTTQVDGERIYIDLGTEFQTIDGFGASDAWRCKYVGKNWPIEKREAIADLLFSRETDADGNPLGIGLSIWRFYIGAGSEEQGNASGIVNDWRRAECFLNEDQSYDWSKQAGQQWFLNSAKEHGVENILGFSISAPVHFTKNGKAYAPEDYYMNIKSGYMDQYADFLVNVIEHFNNEGLAFNYLSPVNETQYSWTNSGQEGTPATNSEIKELVTLLSEKLEVKNQDTEIIIAESGSIKYLYSEENKPNRANLINDFFNSSNANYIGDLPNVKPSVSAHSYWTTANTELLADVRKTLKENNSVGYWQTEYSVLENTNDIGGGWNRDLGINTALFVARVIHADLYYANAQSWQWWTAISQYDYKDGLIYLDNGNNGIRSSDDADSENLKYDGYYRESKTLWALGNFSRFIRPGTKRIKSGFAVPKSDELTLQNLMFSAYKNEEEHILTMVFINYSEFDKNIVLTGLNEKFNIEGGTFSTYTTSEKQNLTKGEVNADALKIPARSIVTLVGKYY